MHPYKAFSWVFRAIYNFVSPVLSNSSLKSQKQKSKNINLETFYEKYFAYKPISDSLFWWFDPLKL